MGLDFEQGIGPPELRLHLELGDVEHGRAARRTPLVCAVVGVAVDHRFHMVEAIDWIAQPLLEGVHIIHDRSNGTGERAVP